MSKFKTKSLFAFALLGLLIFAYRNAHGSVMEYGVAIAVIIIFWYLLGLKFAFSNIRNILFLILILGAIIYIFRVIFPVAGPISTMGMLKAFDLNPAQIKTLKESHALALELHLDHQPTIKDRYFEIGELSYTSDGLHYSNKLQNVDISKFPKTYAWVNAHLIGNKIDHDVDTLKSWFVKSMTYSLSPGSLNSPTPLDQFLFERREGFCEHFAASFTSILRLKGYQSRVVYGYAGGTWNPILRILTFENSDAHAWDEVFDSKIKQYKIIDPTSWIFPEVAKGRTMGTDYSQIYLAILVFIIIFAFFLVRKGSGLERFMLKVARLEKKHALSPKGLTLSERIIRLAKVEQGSKEKMFISLNIYLKMYVFNKPSPQIDHVLKKSLASW